MRTNKATCAAECARGKYSVLRHLLNLWEAAFVSRFQLPGDIDRQISMHTLSH